MNNLLSQKWCLCLNVQNRIKLCRAKNHKFGDEITVYMLMSSENALPRTVGCLKLMTYFRLNYRNG